MKVHFIAIGGSAMHNLAIALSRKGFTVTGSDDEIFEPSKSRLIKEHIFPSNVGWDKSKITKEIDAVILGMHARKDNPELQEALRLKLPIYSYPEYIYEQSKNKTRVVIGGSHGKTTITSMLLHALKKLNFPVDYMVGAQLKGYDCMVKLTKENKVIILEGDEYLSSKLDPRPKFHLYRPNIALLSGIAWDHINVFPTFKNYIKQFSEFCRLIEPHGALIYNSEDKEVKKLAQQEEQRIKLSPYSTPQYKTDKKGTILSYQKKDYPLSIFGGHNLQNLMGAMKIAHELGIAEEDFLHSMKDFTGAGKRLEKVSETENKIVYKDFAHSPSKLKATTRAVKEQYPNKKLIACMELHTFSSLQKEFLPQYNETMEAADKAIVYFSPSVVAHKKLPALSKKEVRDAFGKNINVATSTKEVLAFIKEETTKDTVLLMMSSGDFGGINYKDI